MTDLSEKQHFKQLFQNPVILFDDIHTRIGYFVGIGEQINTESVNFMIKYGKGLLYVCITEETAKRLQLDSIHYCNKGYLNKTMAISIDFKTTTTGISADERATTIKALLEHDCDTIDFRRPGHVIPLIGLQEGFLSREGIAECALMLMKMMEIEPLAYVCEVLNSAGEIASLDELYGMLKTHGASILTFSEVLAITKRKYPWKMQVKVASEVIQMPDLHFIQYCRSTYGLNRGVYNTIDAWFYHKGVIEIVERRKHILNFVTSIATLCKDNKVNFKDRGGLTYQLSHYWRLRLSSDSMKRLITS